MCCRSALVGVLMDGLADVTQSRPLPGVPICDRFCPLLPVVTDDVMAEEVATLLIVLGPPAAGAPAGALSTPSFLLDSGCLGGALFSFTTPGFDIDTQAYSQMFTPMRAKASATGPGFPDNTALWTSD